MQSKLCVVLLALGLSQILAVPAPSLVLTHPETNFMQFLMQSRDLANDGTHSLECLSYYTPLLNSAVEKYNNDFKACLDEATLQVAAINDDTKENRTLIDQSATDSCAALETCSQLTAADEYFECYSEAGSSNAKSMFTISANASELLAYVKEQVHIIQVNEYICTNKTQRTYAEDTADIYESLSLCFSGAPIPTETSSTAAPETSSSLDPESSTDSSSSEPESSSTAEPESSSTDSSSAEPESSSSAAPESSTDSSSVEPESSSTAAPESSTDSSSAEPESSSSAAPEDSSSAEPESSSSAAPEDSSSAEPESSSTAAPEDSSSAEPESSSSAAPEDSSSAEPESSSAAPESSTAEPESSSSAAPDAPEEDLKQIYTGNSNKNLQDILKNLQTWFKTQRA
ncbi:uncharacterized protein [Drosophila kikkawai]|uniref:Protein TsetseEP domain-containing protein n=1 Tax=Drosophila kikkawai TaxID=30033 RepID=A0A6P4I7Y1_DROKI|nr:dentin sialophosphoprotein [Drosophila kikkawai]